MARRRTLYLPLLLAAAVLAVACAAAVATLLAVSKEAEATFPGKNGRIAYQDSFVIYTINPDGSAKRRVTDTHSGGDPIGYSPDGKRITYTDYEGFNGKDTEIYTINVGGGAKTKVTNNNTPDYWPSYLPDGKKIAYIRDRGRIPDIYAIDSSGGSKSRVTGSKYLYSNPSWGSRP